MTNVIKHIVEPKRLLLIWQGPEGSSRMRHVVGELVKTAEGNVALCYSPDRGVLEAAKQDGFQGHPAFRDLYTIHETGVLEAFLRRIPPRSRGDFSAYLTQQRLPATAALSDFALLGYSGARLPSDGFSLVHTFDDEAGPFEFVTEIAGFRHQASHMGIRADELQIGEAVQFLGEPTNPADAHAVQSLVRGRRIGYVMRGLQTPMNSWLKKRDVQGAVDRINGRPDRPAVYVFVAVGPDRDFLAKAS